ncbi:MAG TPA: hypothetical protein ACFYD5_07065, partial [Candidatus Tripitaka sp. YC43]
SPNGITYTTFDRSHPGIIDPAKFTTEQIEKAIPPTKQLALKTELLKNIPSRLFLKPRFVNQKIWL